MEQIDLLKGKGITVIEIKNKDHKLLKQWGVAFAKNLSKNQKRQIYYGHCLWHVFSYDVLPCKKSHKARNAFNMIEKDKCYIFYQDSEYALLLENARSLTSEDITNEIDGFIHDIYVVDKDFSWTYI
jgi:hypothetical protein